MKYDMELVFFSDERNEAFARMVISAFMTRANPMMSVISEVRTAVSEAVTNAIVHAYQGKSDGRIILRASIDQEKLDIEIEDEGCGIEDVELAMQPFFTTQKDGERTGMGFSLMMSFMDRIKVESFPAKGTKVLMTKQVKLEAWDAL